MVILDRNVHVTVMCLLSGALPHQYWHSLTVTIPLKLYYRFHDDVIKWKHLPRYWLFVRRIHRSSVNSPQKGQWRGALMFSFICVWISGWVNNREAGDLRPHRAHYDVIVMLTVTTPLKLYYRFIILCTLTYQNMDDLMAYGSSTEAIV